MRVSEKKKKRTRRILWYVALGLVIVITLLALMFNSGVAALRKISGYVVTPVVSFFGSAGEGVGNFFASFGSRMDLKNQVARLEEQVAQLETEQSVAEEIRSENARLRELLGEGEKYPSFTYCYASVMVSSLDDYSATYTLNKGRHDGIAENMTVIAVGGLAGKIVEVSDNTCVLLAVTDSRCSVPGLAESSRDAGVVTGVSDSGTTQGWCTMKGLPTNAALRPGDTIITSGMGEVYPKGIVIGTVTELTDASTGELTSRAAVAPAVDFEHLENVLIVVSEGK